MPELTQLQSAGQAGDPHTTADLFPLVYNALRRLAAHRMARETPGQTLEPTALVHEVYLRLAGGEGEAPWDDRAHFFGAAAEAMRRILVDIARRKRSVKHGGGAARVPLEDGALFAFEPREDVLAVDEALTRLADTDPAAAEVVQLRYFGGLSLAETAQVLGMAPRTADRYWAYARAWLHRALQPVA
jgi:RNA polymerase sigma factor (TIGR02999 family)